MWLHKRVKSSFPLNVSHICYAWDSTIIHFLPYWLPSFLLQTFPEQWGSTEWSGHFETLVPSSITLFPPVSGESLQSNERSERQHPLVHLLNHKTSTLYQNWGRSGKSHNYSNSRNNNPWALRLILLLLTSPCFTGFLQYLGGSKRHYSSSLPNSNRLCFQIPFFYLFLNFFNFL